jgi:hypothetical protein
MPTILLIASLLTSSALTTWSCGAGAQQPPAPGEPTPDPGMTPPPDEPIEPPTLEPGPVPEEPDAPPTPDPSAPCCFTNPSYAGTCAVRPIGDETCASILDYLNNPSSTGKNYCNATGIRGGWEPATCEGDE